MIQAWSYKPSKNWSNLKKVLQIQTEKGLLLFLFEILESHLQSKAYQSNALLQYMDFLAECVGEGGRFID